VTAGIVALLPDATATGVLLGLGGGGLVNLWQYLNTAWNLTAVELDPTVAEIAAEHFSLDCQKLDVRIGDGLSVQGLRGDKSVTSTEEVSTGADVTNDAIDGEKNSVLGFETESLDFIVIDVDSKDTGTGMSCPPAAFVEVAYLQILSSLLRPSTGVLAINVSARDPSLFQNVCQTVRSVFPSVLLSKRCPNKYTSDDDGEEDEEEDLNVVVFATRRLSEALPPLREMTDRVTQRIRQSQENDNSAEVDEIVVSDLCLCLEEFTVFDVNESTSSSKMNFGNKKKTGSSKRRNTKRGNNKRR
jgi:hypothetical protein